MKVLIAYFSSTGNTEKVAELISNEMQKRGHKVFYERIKAVKPKAWYIQVMRDAPKYLSLGFGIMFNFWHKRYIQSYRQLEDDIIPLQYEDVSEFDALFIGSPKWTQISFPVARYLKSVKGLQHKKVGLFATFAGPPLQRFELNLIFKTMERFLTQRKATVIDSIGISSARHPNPALMPFFWLASIIRFGRSIRHFTINSQYSKDGILRVCDAVEEAIKKHIQKSGIVQNDDQSVLDAACQKQDKKKSSDYRGVTA